MTEKELLEELEAIAPLCGFIPDQTPPYLVRLGEDDFRELKKYGNFKHNGKPITIEITNSHHLPKDLVWQDELRDEYNQLAGPETIKLPQVIMRAARGRDKVYTVLERPEGDMIINFDDFKKTFSHEDETYKKIVETAKVHWETRKILDQLAQKNLETAARIERATWNQYFENRFENWSKEIKKVDLNFDYISSITLQKIRDRIFKSYKFDGRMELSFNLLGNTDIRKTKNDEYYLVNGRFAIMPAGFSIAAWLWNMVMWSWQKNPNDLINDIFTALKVFCETAPLEIKNLEKYILANLLERIYASINVDIRYLRAPFHDINPTGVANELKNFFELLNKILNLDDIPC